jgi:hypothetical protein
MENGPSLLENFFFDGCALPPHAIMLSPGDGVAMTCYQRCSLQRESLHTTVVEKGGTYAFTQEVGPVIVLTECLEFINRRLA